MSFTQNSSTALLLVLTLAFCGCSNPALNWERMESPTKAHLRGLSVVNDEVVWASGSEGVVLRTINGGESWEEIVVPGAENMQFRDIEAFNEQEAIIISAGAPARIYSTADGGQSWELNYEDTTPDIFLDGFTFWDRQHGMAYGDPMSKALTVMETIDGGKSWKTLDTNALPEVLKGEAGFAASGTGIVAKGTQEIWIATGGGSQARIMFSADGGQHWETYDTPLRSEEGAGIFSLAMWSKTHGVVVGGSYTDSASTQGVCAITADGSKTWKAIEKKQPNGYRSCVAATDDGGLLIAVGRTGSDCSKDGGESWEPISLEGYYSCAFSGNYCWASGKGGKLARMQLQ